MSTIWGTQYCKMVLGGTTVNLLHAIIEPNFMIPDTKMHESKLTGMRTWSRKRVRMEFTVMEYLFKYDDPVAKATEIMSLENNVVTFTFANDGGLTQDMYLEPIDIYGLVKPYDYDVAVLNFKSEDWLNISRRLKTKDGKWIKTKSGDYIKTKGIVI